MPDKSEKGGGRGGHAWNWQSQYDIALKDYSSDIILISDTQLLYQGYEQGIILTHFI